MNTELIQEALESRRPHFYGLEAKMHVLIGRAALQPGDYAYITDHHHKAVYALTQAEFICGNMEIPCSTSVYNKVLSITTMCGGESVIRFMETGQSLRGMRFEGMMLDEGIKSFPLSEPDSLIEYRP